MDRDQFRLLAGETIQEIIDFARTAAPDAHEQSEQSWGMVMEPSNPDGTSWTSDSRDVENLLPWVLKNRDQIHQLPKTCALLAAIRPRVRVEHLPPGLLKNPLYKNPAERVLENLLRWVLDAVPNSGPEADDLTFLLDALDRDLWEPAESQKTLGIVPVANVLLDGPIVLHDGLTLRSPTGADHRRIQRSHGDPIFGGVDAAAMRTSAVVDVALPAGAVVGEAIFRLAAFLRLYRPCGSFVGMFFQHPRIGTLDPGSAVIGPPLQAPRVDELSFMERLDLRADSSAFASKYREVADACADDVVALALRWFAKGSHDLHAEDWFLAQMIALETLVLGGRRGPKKGGPKKFQLGRRMAAYLRSTEDERKKLRERVEFLYDRRNELVHEGKMVAEDGSHPANAIRDARIELDALLRELLLCWVEDPPDWKQVQAD